MTRFDLFGEIECNLAVVGEIFIDFADRREVILSDRLEEWAIELLQQQLGDRFEQSLEAANWRVWSALREHISDRGVQALHARSTQRVAEIKPELRLRRALAYYKAEKDFLVRLGQQRGTTLADVVPTA